MFSLMLSIVNFMSRSLKKLKRPQFRGEGDAKAEKT